MIWSQDNTEEKQNIKGIDNDGSGNTQLADIKARKSESNQSESGNMGWLSHSMDGLQGMKGILANQEIEDDKNKPLTRM